MESRECEDRDEDDAQEINGKSPRMPALDLATESDDLSIETSDSRRLLTSRSAANIGFLSADLIMARLGVYDPMGTKELILRDAGIIGIHEEFAQTLVALEVLSLSHNKLTSLDGFQYFSNLIELNLNFNQITSISNLQCPGLEKLFLSNNRVVDATSLKGFTKLNTLCLYGNLITDLEATLSTCRALAKLRSLDLGGNPCSQEVEGYKFQVVRSLPRLKSLDGEQVTQLDKELAEEFVRQDRPSSAVDSNLRPSTATMIGSRPLTATPKPWESDAPPSPPLKTYDPFASKHMPKGNVRLFRDDFLNNNPILLEYLAQETQESPVTAEVLTLDEAPADLQRSSSFVEKMRTANPVAGGDESPEDDASQDHVLPPAQRPYTAGRPTTAAVSTTAFSTSNLGIDPSDPKTTIRKLLKHIEVLEESLASYTTRQVEASEQALLEENRRLQIENNNIPILQEQVASLKKKLSAGVCPPVPQALTQLPVDAVKRVAELESENDKLKREVARLTRMLKSDQVISGELPSMAKENGSSGTATVRLGDSTLLEESAAIDVELTELILQNEVSLEMIRNDIKNTKKEWETQIQEAKQRELETHRSRPQTSLGLALSSSSSAERLLSTGPATTGKPIQTGEKPRRQSRQLHTSAGFRHGAGPEELLLHQANATIGRSTTNILTL